MAEGHASIRVLYSVAETHPSFRADVAVLFGKYLPRLGVQSDLLTLHHLQPAPDWGGGVCLTRPGPARGAKRHLLSVLSDLRMLWLAPRGYQAIIVRDKSVGALLGLLAARLAGIPFFYWMSFPMVEAWAVFARDRGVRQVGVLRWLAAKLRATLLRWLLYRVVLPGARHVFVQSETMRLAVVRQGIAAERMTAVPMGVDTETDLASMSDDLANKLDTPTFAYLGTLNRPRQPELMIQAVAVLVARGVRVRLMLIGDAEEAVDRQWLRGLVQQYQLSDWIEITGWMPAAAGQRLCAAALAGLSPIPRTELLEVSSPTKLVEYFNLGLPAIANDLPDQAYLMQAAGGTCAPLTAEGFADAMQDVLARPAHHRAVARAGQALVRRERSYGALAALVARQLRRCI